jgi:hypothetical protein
LLATDEGLLRTTKDKLINHYYKGKTVWCLCYLTDSIYLLGFSDDKLRVWDQQKEQEMYQMNDDSVESIKRVMKTDNFILRIYDYGLKLLSIRDL